MDMDILEQLEQHIDTLLSQVEAFQQENSELKNKLAENDITLTEQAYLRDELEQERAKNNAALHRMESILHRLRERTNNG